VQKYTALDGIAGNDFGYSVDIDEGSGLAVVGAPNNNIDPAFTGRPGAAYVYDTLTAIETILTPSDSSGGDEYGWSVAIDKTRVAIGAPQRGVSQGAAYVRDLVSGVEMKLTPPTSFDGDDFGYAVDILDNLVIVGAPGNENPYDEPSNRAFVYSAITGELIEELFFSDGAGDDEYGFSVELCNNQAVVGAPLHNLTGKVDAGAAYVYSFGQSGDTDLDRDVDITDFDTLAAHFDPDGDNAPHPWAHGNLDGNLTVDITDFVSLADNYLPTGYGSHVVPTWDGDSAVGQVSEPATVLLVCLAVAILTGVGVRKR